MDEFKIKVMSLCEMIMIDINVKKSVYVKICK